MRQRYWPCKKL